MRSSVSLPVLEERGQEQGGDRIRDLESQLNHQQENFSDKMRDMEEVIRRQEEMIAKMKRQDGNHVNGISGH